MIVYIDLSCNFLKRIKIIIIINPLETAECYDNVHTVMVFSSVSTTSNKETFSLKLPINSETFVQKFLENPTCCERVKICINPHKRNG